MAAMWHIHFPFASKDAKHPKDLQGHRCPFVGDTGHGCVIYAILNQRAIRCSGLEPPDVCPMAHGNDIVVSMQHRSNLIVNPNEG